jgi:uncharacterized protein (TIGR02996 family)
MTDIDAMHAHLDSHPDDHGARLVLADRLEDAGSPLAEGMRALALMERWPVRDQLDSHRGHWVYGRWFYHCDDHDAIRANFPETCLDCNELPSEWVFRANKVRAPDSQNRVWCGYVQTRREAEEQAAEGFARLPESQRRELLAKLYTPAG